MAIKDFECSSGKIPHQTREAAEAHARSIQEKDGHFPHIYTCQECGFLHIGGGRKSDRPAWLQTHSSPILPPDKLPRKSYERRQVDKGESVSVEDAIRNILQSREHVFISDKEIADRFQMNWWVVRDLRIAMGIPNREKRLDEVVLSALQKNPGLHRGKLAKELGCSEGAILDRVVKFGFAGTGRPGTFGRGSKATQWGRKHNAGARAKIRAATLRQFASPEARAAAAAKQSAWAKAHPGAVRANLKDAWRASNSPEALKKISQSLKEHYANCPETGKRAAESRRRFLASMKPEQRQAWEAARNQKVSEGQKARWERVRAAKAASAEIRASSELPSSTGDLPQSESTS
jgi:hypothetical protein